MAHCSLPTKQKKFNHDPEILYYLFLPLTIWGLVGARLWHILTPPLSSVQLGLTTQHYLSHPLDALALWIGGFGLPGAILFGAITLYFFSRNNQLPFLQIADILAPGLALAQAIGRLGNYFNQELYGLPTSLTWKIFIDSAHRLRGYENIEFYHPLFAYEMILNIVNLILLLWFSHKLLSRNYGVRELAPVLKQGDVFLIYLTFYSLTRFLLEFLRLDVALINGVNINQIFFAIFFVAAGGFLLWRHRLAQNL